ncbi:MAG: hypothetical protein GY787_12560, partial [Alteromonadales bacterium]|nr:hypothetical protein [Alteromonadales bacterium]
EYSLPVKYYPDNKGAPKEQQITRHKPEPAQALRNISLAPPQLRAHIYEKY